MMVPIDENFTGGLNINQLLQISPYRCYTVTFNTGGPVACAIEVIGEIVGLIGSSE